MKPFSKYIVCFLTLFLVACTQSYTPAQSVNKENFTPTTPPTLPAPKFTDVTPSRDTPVDQPTEPLSIATDLPNHRSTVISTPTTTHKPSATMRPEGWKDLPVIPTIGPRIAEIYQHGLTLGNNPKSFSKIGDCGSTPAWFLGDFDRGPQFYRLGEHQYLEAVIQEFKGSYGRTSLAARSGFNAASIFAPIWSDPSQCLAGESPLACEYRINKPVMAFIMLGSNDVYHLDMFESDMRRIIEFSIESGVIPILSTKADNIEGDGSINAIISRLALEYGIPLWNYWAALQELPEQGLQNDKVHLTWGPNRFDDPLVMTRAWPVRNLTALQILDTVWRSAIGINPAIP